MLYLLFGCFEQFKIVAEILLILYFSTAMMNWSYLQYCSLFPAIFIIHYQVHFQNNLFWKHRCQKTYEKQLV